MRRLLVNLAWSALLNQTIMPLVQTYWVEIISTLALQYVVFSVLIKSSPGYVDLLYQLFLRNILY